MSFRLRCCSRAAPAHLSHWQQCLLHYIKVDFPACSTRYLRLLGTVARLWNAHAAGSGPGGGAAAVEAASMAAAALDHPLPPMSMSEEIRAGLVCLLEADEERARGLVEKAIRGFAGRDGERARCGGHWWVGSCQWGSAQSIWPQRRDLDTVSSSCADCSTRVSMCEAIPPTVAVCE